MTLPNGVVSEEALWFDADGTPVDDPADAATAEITQTLADGTRMHTIADLRPPAISAGTR
jgi:hypothetical protein